MGKKTPLEFKGVLATNESGEDVWQKIGEYVDIHDNGWSCKICGKASNFYKKQNIMNHTETHLGGISYTCPYSDCGKSFRSKNSLSCHKSVYHKI